MVSRSFASHSSIPSPAWIAGNKANSSALGGRDCPLSCGQERTQSRMDLQHSPWPSLGKPGDLAIPVIRDLVPKLLGESKNWLHRPVLVSIVEILKDSERVPIPVAVGVVIRLA